MQLLSFYQCFVLFVLDETPYDLNNYFVFLSGNYFLRDDTTIIVLRDHIFRAGEHLQYTPIWTFNASSYYKIRFHFTEYDCARWSSHSGYCYVKIGNGLVSGQNQILHHFGGNTPSSDTISSFNTAWLQARVSYSSKIWQTCSIAMLIYKYI